MAYGVKYEQMIYPLGASSAVMVQILEKDYVGSITPLTILHKGVTISVNPIEYFDSILSMSCEIEIVNDRHNFYEFASLFSAEDFQYKILIYNDELTLFEGFVPCEFVEQKYLPKGRITLNATNNLNRLSEFNLTGFSTYGKYAFIDIIKNCLSKTGLDLPIYVNCSLYDYQMPIPQNPFYTQSTTKYGLFDAGYVDRDLLIDNAGIGSFSDCSTVLSGILKAFNCKLYYWDGKWIIERMKDLEKETKLFIVYNTNGTISTLSDSFVEIEDPAKFTERTQVIGYVPGMKKIKLTLDEKEKSNSINPSFDAITSHTTEPESIWPALLAWEKRTTTAYSIFQDKYKIIENGIHLENQYDVSAAPIEDVFNTLLEPADANILAAETRNSINGGIFTKFTVSLNEITADNIENTTLSITLDFALPENFLEYNDGQFLEEMLANPTGHRFYLRFFLKTLPTNGYVVKNGVTGKFQIVTRSNIVTDNSGINPALIQVPITFSEFTSKSNYSTTITADVSLTDFWNTLDRSYADVTLALGICEIGYARPGGYGGAMGLTLKHSNFGDIVIKVNNKKQDNILEGIIPNAFIENYEDNLFVYDVTTLSLTNGIWNYSTNMDVRTRLWGDSTITSSGAENFAKLKPLKQKNIEDKFQYYNKVRRQISGNLHFILPIHPYAVYDELINGEADTKFYVAGYQWDVESCIYNNILLKELVGDDGIS